MSNPFLNDKNFNGSSMQRGSVDAQSQQGWTQGGPYVGYGAPATTSGATMTMGGVTSATALLFVFAAISGWFGWRQVGSELVGYDRATGEAVFGATGSMVWMFGPLIVGFILAMVCSFRPTMARYLAIPYALAEGVFLGFVSHYYNIAYPGIVVTALLATAGVFGAMLALYSFRVLRVTPRMTKAIVAATFGVLAVYLVNFVASFFMDGSLLSGSGPISIAVSLIIVGIAAFNLLLDFDFIERGVENGLPKHMEWFAAFGLMVTIVWLYLELLRLLSKLRDN
ncbi:MAG: Bax inhibitor-1/YccA family protein [Actinobacteria bacterium]|nr:Bax inhibitor-1/YccA family protein [Actinomycetota bacterium]